LRAGLIGLRGKARLAAERLRERMSHTE
jgi:hypothetical protein